MSRPAIDRLPQRQLVYEYRLAIDDAIAGRRRGRDRVRRLMEDNPRSTWSTHVIYNIGKRRAEYLRDLLPF